MKVHISEIRKSPINPKKDFTKNQLESLRESIRRYGFSASLVVCRDYEKKSKYIVIDGNSRLSLLGEFNITEIDIVINENVKNRSDLIDFISIFDNIKKKYDFSMLNDLQKEMSDFSKNLLHLQSRQKKYQNEILQETIIYMLSLPVNTVNNLKRIFISRIVAEKKLIEYVNNISDEKFLQIILENYNKEKPKKRNKI